MTAHFVILSLAKGNQTGCKAKKSRQNSFFVILSVSEISTEFKIHFKFKVKNPRLKYANSRFYFMDTSLSAKAQYDKNLRH